ncbi:MAG: hypothetical protein F6K24_39910, partial [Okeania sp. SIO2D1]|nr:hypothetical protein [Okeania sp. SIO2D1]
MNATSWLNFRWLGKDDHFPTENSNLKSTLQVKFSPITSKPVPRSPFPSPLPRFLASSRTKTAIAFRNGQNISKMLQPEQLNQLIAQTCQHPAGSWQCRRCLSKLISAIAKSGKLWQEK